MRLHLAFALLVGALVAVSGWMMWRDAFPTWRTYQRVLGRRQIARLTAGLDSARAVLARPEVRYELARLDRAIVAAAADTAGPAARRARIRARLEALERRTGTLRAALRQADARLRDPALAQRSRDLESRLDRVREEQARITGAWPPDTPALARLRARRDSLAREQIAIEGPVQALRDSLLANQSEAQGLRIEVARIPSPRDSLEALRARLLEPVASREAALARLRRERPRVREIVSADGKELARCPTCHGAIDDAPGVHPPLPAMDVFRDVPCTACHRGRGRELGVAEAHRGLVASGDFASGPYSIPARIERLRSRDPEERARAREELAQIAGVDPAADGAVGAEGGDRDSAAARAWTEWWNAASPYFEPGGAQLDESGNDALAAAGIDPWIFSLSGRPLHYVGSRKCLSCHEVRHREHSRRWMATKFRSIERLVGERDPQRCFPCHTTGYDPATGAYAEPGVTCEGCHGPGERYNEMMTVGQELLGKGQEARGRALLDVAARLAREAINRRLVPGDRGPANVCVTCHQPWQHRDGGPPTLDRPSPASLAPQRGPGASRTGG